MHQFLKRIIFGKQLKHDKGQLVLLGVPSYLFALNSLVTFQKMLEDAHGKTGLSYMYYLLGYQTGMGAKIMKNRLGMAKEKAMQMHMGQSEMVGAGNIEFVRMDMKANHFVLRSESSFAKEYLHAFGQQKEPVDWMFKGGITYLLNEYLERDDMVCIETSCIAQGKQYCEFLAKPAKDFDLKDPEIKKQLPEKVDFDFKKIMEKNFMGMPQRK